MSLKSVGAALALSLCALCGAGGAGAVVIISTYQGGSQPGGWAFGGAMAVQFTPAQNTYLTDVQLYVMSGGMGFPSALDVHLMADAANLPGAVIETLGKLPTQTSFTPKLEQILSKTNPLLTAGTPYWIAASFHPLPDSSVAAGWAGSGSPSVLTASSQNRLLTGPWTAQQNGPQFIISGSITQPVCMLDLDGNGQIDALTDGIMFLRAMFSLTGDAVTTNAIGPMPQRTTWSQIEPFVFLGKLDLDGNGKTDALTDGLLLLRAMFGLKGSVVTDNALGPNPTRMSWDDVRGYLNGSCGTSYTQ